MHPEYLETHFKSPGLPEVWPDEFVIITAYATTGESWTPWENSQADRRLRSELEAKEVWLRRVTGFSPTTEHTEPGWAAELPLDDACELGLHFQQDAIFHVRCDQLSVTYCDERRRLVAMGAFRERLHSEPAG